jgi:predicted ATPase
MPQKANAPFPLLKDNYFVLTGTFGSGKSTLLDLLQTRGIRGVEEPARAVLAEQRRLEGDGVPERNPQLFVELMLSRMLNTYRQNEASPRPVLFDRGIPDLLAYAALFDFEFSAGENAARLYRYNSRIFIALPWEEIYCTDDERKAPYSLACKFDNDLRRIYERFGYSLIDLPCASVEDRADFVLDRLGAP